MYCFFAEPAAAFFAAAMTAACLAAATACGSKRVSTLSRWGWRTTCTPPMASVNPKICSEFVVLKSGGEEPGAGTI